MPSLAFHPRKKFRSISITGTYCALNCDMCRGFYLRQMLPANSPQILEKLCLKLRERGVEGFLISGGYDRRGALPVEPFLESIKRIKKMTGALISLHSGMIDPRILEGAEDFIDFIDFEFLTSRESIKNVKKLNYTPEDYLDRMDSLSRIVRVVPHFVLGLPGSSPSDVLSYLREVSKMTDGVVILVLKQTPGAPGSKLSWSLEDLKNTLLEARKSVPSVTLSLGCMRPSGLKDVLDEHAVEIGFDRIANPRANLVEKYRMSVFKCCCSVPTSELWRFL